MPTNPQLVLYEKYIPACSVGVITLNLSCVNMCISVVLPALSNPMKTNLASFLNKPIKESTKNIVQKGKSEKKIKINYPIPFAIEERYISLLYNDLFHLYTSNCDQNPPWYLFYSINLCKRFIGTVRIMMFLMMLSQRKNFQLNTKGVAHSPNFATYLSPLSYFFRCTYLTIQGNRTPNP